jgi:hypothetical protein
MILFHDCPMNKMKEMEKSDVFSRFLSNFVFLMKEG